MTTETHHCAACGSSRVGVNERNDTEFVDANGEDTDFTFDVKLIVCGDCRDVSVTLN